MFVLPPKENQESLVYDGAFIKVQTLEKDERVWEKVYLRHAVMVFPVTNQRKILMVKEKRPHETPNWRIKAVTGLIEEGLSVKENINKEMQEEIGFKSDDIEVFAKYSSTGTINQALHIALAKNLTASKIPNPDGEETIQELLELSADELFQMVEDEKIPWGFGTLGIFGLKRELRANRLSL